MPRCGRSPPRTCGTPLCGRHAGAAGPRPSPVCPRPRSDEAGIPPA